MTHSRCLYLHSSRLSCIKLYTDAVTTRRRSPYLIIGFHSGIPQLHITPVSQERSGPSDCIPPSRCLAPFDFLCLKHLVIDTCFLHLHLQPHCCFIPSPHSTSQLLCLPSSRRSATRLNKFSPLHTGTRRHQPCLLSRHLNPTSAALLRTTSAMQNRRPNGAWALPSRRAEATTPSL